MSDFLSAFLSLLGLGQNSAQVVSSKRLEAVRLNEDFEMLLHKAAELLRNERLHITHRIAALAVDPIEDKMEFQQQVDQAVEHLLSEIKAGLETASNSRSAIENASTFSSVRKWDEVVATLQRQRNAAELQLDRAQNLAKQFHRIIDNAQD